MEGIYASSGLSRVKETSTGMGRDAGRDGKPDCCRESEIPRAMGELEKRLAEHHDILMELSARLSPVLIPDQPGELCCPSQECGSALAQKIALNVSGVKTCTDAVRGILARLQL